jgi:heme A synthase
VTAYRLALATTIATFVLLVVGGTVNPTGSSLACPDWPTCYGSFFPEMTGGVEFEHTHRAVATFVGFLTLVLSVVIWRTHRHERLLVRLGFGALGLVILQGVLGGITVLMKLPPAVSMMHLALSMFFFVYLMVLTHRLRPVAVSEKVDEGQPIPRCWIAWAVGGLYIQILLGGLIRHSGSALACGTDIPWCLGAAWPAHGLGQIHMLHRYGSLVVTALVLVAAASAAWHGLRNERRVAFFAAFLAPWLLLIQIVLGVMTVQSTIGVIEVVAHMGVGSLMLADLVVIYLALSPRRQAAEHAVDAVETPSMSRGHLQEATS